MVMAKSYRKKIGFVSLWRDSKGKWKARFLDPTTGRDVRRTLQVSSEAEAIEAVKMLNRAVIEERGLIPSSKERRADDLTVADALAESIRSTRGNRRTKARYVQGANAFQRFLEANYPGVQSWRDVRPSMIVGWFRAMQDRKLAYDTIRLALVPIRRASAYWAAEAPEKYRDVAKAAKGQLVLPRPPRKAIEVLDARQLGAFLEWLRLNAPHLLPMACLSGLSGLRMLEAAYLRHCDIDWNAGTVTVTETGLHTPKNRGSYRTIPVSHQVLEAIRDYLDSAKVQGIGEQPLFLNQRGRPWTFDGLMTAWYRTKGRAASKMESFGVDAFQPHCLRASFATLAREAGADVRFVQLYLGHAPNDTLGEHYEAVSVARLRREIVDVVSPQWEAQRASGWQNLGNTESDV